MSERKRILIVEDNIDFANELAKNFENGGFDTLHADSIDIAIEMLHNNKIDGMSLDIQLKGSLGINLLDKIYSGELGLKHIPVIIVVSSFINPPILRALKSHRVLYYDKAAPGFNFTMILDSFSSLLSVAPRGADKRTELPANDNLKIVIRQRLEVYDFKVKSIAYARMVDGIYYMILSDSTQKRSLTGIFEAMGIEFSTVFIGMKRLLHESFRDKEIVPTPADFVYMIADEIMKDFPGV